MSKGIFIKILVISHNVFSKTSNMGKTLLQYFNGMEGVEVSQFYIHTEVPTDSSVCTNYFRFTDYDAIRSLFSCIAWFEETEKIQFEKVLLRVPSGLHDFLVARFGDYLVIPSKDRIKWEQHALFWDVKESCSSNLKSESSFADERNLV
jgi:hypothetical protein